MTSEMKKNSFAGRMRKNKEIYYSTNNMDALFLVNGAFRSGDPERPCHGETFHRPKDMEASADKTDILITDASRSNDAGRSKKYKK